MEYRIEHVSITVEQLIATCEGNWNVPQPALDKHFQDFGIVDHVTKKVKARDR
jgi:hypothetical protein